MDYLTKKLFVHVRDDDLSRAKPLLVNGVDPNSPNELGNTPIFYVQSLEMLALLRHHEASFTVTNDKGLTPHD